MDSLALLVRLVKITPSDYPPAFNFEFPTWKVCTQEWRANDIRAHVNEAVIDQFHALFWKRWPALRLELLAQQAKRQRKRPTSPTPVVTTAPRKRGSYLFVRPPEAIRKRPLL